MSYPTDSINIEEFNKITDRAMTERALLAQCLTVLKMTGWRVHHVFEQGKYARRTDKGFPDICATKHGRIIYAELKREKGVIAFEQECWLNDLSQNIGSEVYVVRPSTRQEFYDCLVWESRPLKVEDITWKGDEP